MLLTLFIVVDISVAPAPRAALPVPGSRPQVRVPDSMTNAERMARGLPPRAPKALFDLLKSRAPMTSSPSCRRNSGNGNGNGNSNGNGNGG
ncbi:hypothetical protein GGU10DRAFT_373691 [Lentinula aff. detonsa]|uniref:Secreted protein n=1 Tax=Lentinula aff. detonsa TaxID=2804958 RepID=A0AA38KBE8_9AGAR|nr:hypothetical protein GGU10DRAFT_373691 [Lentinula aff. detonsa]